MTGNKELFVDLDEKQKGEIVFGNDSKVPIEGKGDILVLTKSGGHRLITQVYFVPSLKANILSLGQLLENGYDIHLKGLNLLSKENMVEGLPLITQPNQLCDGCLLGKQVRKPFPKESSSRATKPLQLVHADICGPIKPSSHGKSNYFLLFIDDFSRKTWVYFLTRKDEAFGVFQKFKTQVENESGFTIKALRTDRGGEFTSMEFNKFCETNEDISLPLLGDSNHEDIDATPNSLDRSRDESSSNSLESPRRTRSLRDLYDSTDMINNSSLLCLFADTEPLHFKEATQEEKWRFEMDEEIQAIQKNDTWELSTLTKGQKAIGVK
ncbi:hypothetical protein L6164_001086 [Bauhinia variegata]|uniref:Uncharacterized protein n=1 Tax=Bauhinia variegata TaxID=167791 RepID=A0ACB9Q8I0_BAUVA|nr:hypothetical protein L6164_001086 [Bauhinia variegata]